MKKPEDKPKPKIEDRPSIVTPMAPIKVEQPKPVVVTPEPIKVDRPIISKVDKPKNPQFPELSDVEVRVWKFIKKDSTIFPQTIWSISNWCEISEDEAERVCNKLIKDPKYMIHKVRHHRAEYAFEYF